MQYNIDVQENYVKKPGKELEQSKPELEMQLEPKKQPEKASRA